MIIITLSTVLPRFWSYFSSLSVEYVKLFCIIASQEFPQSPYQGESVLLFLQLGHNFQD